MVNQIKRVMKELTIKEKAQRYDEAIERACKIKNGEPIDIPDGTPIPVAIFPELAESEDEKIRKELLKHVQYLVDYYNDSIPNYGKWLTWLENQGAHAALSKDEQNKLAKGVLRSCAFSFINYLDSHRYEGKMDVSSVECDDIENAFQNAMWDRLHRYYCKYIEKQGEQKPATIIPKFRIGDYVKNVNDKREPIYEIVYMDKECYVCEYRGKENMGDKAVMHFAFDYPYLRHIHKTAWSEKDDAMFNFIALILRNHQSDEDFTTFETTFKDCIDWLKSLKPQNKWKPSEEQIEALEFVIKPLDEMLHSIGHIDNVTKPRLKEILVALKKLREEKL